MRAVARAASDEVVRGQAELFARLDTIEGLRAWSEALMTPQQTRNAITVRRLQRSIIDVM